jgi:hypothetical protein
MTYGMDHLYRNTCVCSTCAYIRQHYHPIPNSKLTTGSHCVCDECVLARKHELAEYQMECWERSQQVAAVTTVVDTDAKCTHLTDKKANVTPMVETTKTTDTVKVADLDKSSDKPPEDNVSRVMIHTLDPNERKMIGYLIPRDRQSQFTFTAEPGHPSYTDSATPGVTHYVSKYRFASWNLCTFAGGELSVYALQDLFGVDPHHNDDQRVEALHVMIDIYHIAKHYQLKCYDNLMNAMKEVLNDWFCWPVLEMYRSPAQGFLEIIHGEKTPIRDMICQAMLYKYEPNTLRHYMCDEIAEAVIECPDIAPLFDICFDCNTLAKYPKMLKRLLDVKQVYGYYKNFHNKEGLKTELLRLSTLTDDTRVFAKAVVQWSYLMDNYQNAKNAYHFDTLRVSMSEYRTNIRAFITSVEKYQAEKLKTKA